MILILILLSSFATLYNLVGSLLSSQFLKTHTELILAFTSVVFFGYLFAYEYFNITDIKTLIYVSVPFLAIQAFTAFTVICKKIIFFEEYLNIGYVVTFLIFIGGYVSVL